MSLKSFFLKSFGGIALFLAMLPAARLILPYSDDTVALRIGFAVGVVALVGLAIGLFIASSDRRTTARVPQASPSAPQRPTITRSAKRDRENKIIAFIALFFVIIACLFVVTLFHGDTAADQSGINVLWYGAKRVGIFLLTLALIYEVRSVSQKVKNPSPSPEATDASTKI